MEDQLSSDATADEYRAHFEKLIGNGGVDITTGGELWKQYREFEKDEYADIADAQAEATNREADPEGLQEAKARVIKLFHRQLAIPLVGNQQVLQEFEAWLAVHCVESDLSLVDPVALEKKCIAAAAALETRLPFEMHLISDAYDAETAEGKAQSWLGYIRFELSEQAMSRARRLFERSLGFGGFGTQTQTQEPCSEVPAMWTECVSFARNVVKDWRLVETVTAQCRHLFSGDAEFWKTRLIALELTGCSADALKDELALISSNCAFCDVHDYMNLLQFGCDFFKRRLCAMLTAHGYPDVDADSLALGDATVAEALAYVKDFRSCCEKFEGFVDTHYPEWTEGWLLVVRYRVAVEEALIEEVLSTALPGPATATGLHVCQCSELFNALLKRFPKSYYVYTEYIHWAVNVAHDYDAARRLYRRGLTTISEFVEEFARQWACWERQCATSTIQQVMEMEAKVTTVLQALATKRVKEDVRTEKVAGASEMDARRAAGNVEKTTTGRKRGALVGESETTQDNVKPAKRARPDSSPAHTDAATCAVQVGNLPFTTTAKEVFEFVIASALPTTGEDGAMVASPVLVESQFALVLSKAGKPRGLVSINGISTDAQNYLISQFNGMPFCGRPLRVAALEIATPTADRPNNHDPTTVYVTRLPLEAVDADLESVFNGFGEIFAARITRDKITKKSKVGLFVWQAFAVHC